MNSVTKITAATAIEICQDFDWDEGAGSILTPQITPLEFVSALIEKAYFLDAIRFLSFALPKRKAIWWAYLAAAQTENGPPETADKKPNTQAITQNGLHAIKQWIYEPTDEARRQMQPLAEALAMKTATSWVAMAVFWSGGSITGLEDPAVEPDATLYAKAVAGAIQLAAVIQEPEDAPKKYARFLAQGVDLANGGNGEI